MLRFGPAPLAPPKSDDGVPSSYELALRNKIVEALMEKSMGAEPIQHWTQGAAKLVGAYGMRKQMQDLIARDRAATAYDSSIWGSMIPGAQQPPSSAMPQPGPSETAAMPSPAAEPPGSKIVEALSEPPPAPPVPAPSGYDKVISGLSVPPQQPPQPPPQMPVQGMPGSPSGPGMARPGAPEMQFFPSGARMVPQPPAPLPGAPPPQQTAGITGMAGSPSGPSARPPGPGLMASGISDAPPAQPPQAQAYGPPAPDQAPPPTGYQQAISMLSPDMKAKLADYMQTGGQHLTPQDRAWCAAFMNATQRHAGNPGTGSDMAKSFLNYGTPVPRGQQQPGDIAIMNRTNNPALGHVGYYTGPGPGGGINVLGGNQGPNRDVNVSEFPAGRVAGFARPPMPGAQQPPQAPQAPVRVAQAGGMDPSILQRMLASPNAATREMAKKVIMAPYMKEPMTPLQHAQMEETRLKSEDLRRKMAGTDPKAQMKMRTDEVALSNTEAQLSQLAESANEVLKHPGLNKIVGGVYQTYAPNIPGGNAADAAAKLENLKIKVGFAALQAMRDASKTGGALGQITERETEWLQNSLVPLQNAQSYEQMQQALQGILNYVDDAKGRLRSGFNNTYGIDAGPRPGADGWTDVGGAVRIREKR